MASTKKKPSAKRTVKYAAKAQTAAARTAAHATHAAVNKGTEWASKGAAEWQKGANEWAKQSAKMYQLPFGQNEAQTAASSMQSAAEGMMKMGSDMMQQMFGQAKKTGFNSDAFSAGNLFKAAPQLSQFDPAGAQEKLTHFARESAEQFSKSANNSTRAMNEAMEMSRENMQVMMDVTAVATTVSKELGAEFVSYLNKLFSQNVELSKQVLSCRTLNDMFDLSGRMVKTNLDGFFSESVKMSEMLFQCATDVSEPLNERMSENTERMTKVMAA